MSLRFETSYKIINSHIMSREVKSLANIMAFTSQMTCIYNADKCTESLCSLGCRPALKSLILMSHAASLKGQMTRFWRPLSLK